MRKLKMSELNRMSTSDFKKSPKTPLIIILDNVRSAHNIGSVFRTADAFRVEKIYLCGITAVPPNKDIQKTALGSTASVDWSYEKDTLDLVQRLKAEGVKVWGIEQTEGATGLKDFNPPSDAKTAVVFGHEVKGVQQSVIDSCDGVIEIPQFGTKHSLNIAVSAGIVIWDIFQKMR